ncbi:phospholipase A1-like [Tribolium madens]|uniref:phospholipase A1-like n=1 Tax=Tribolium madens TaxID=41895 RepID=UPI001CF763E1|nr:phospholipase A1-like [Tribolium madens]
MCKQLLILFTFSIFAPSKSQFDFLKNLQPPQPPTLPTLDAFLSQLFDVTSNEIKNLADNFNFHDVSHKDITFILHLPKNKTVILDPKKPTIEATKPTKIIVHGWQASGTDEKNSELAETYHKTGDYNVIAVDWSEHAKKVYVHASSSTKDIGHVIGDFILEITKKDPKLLENIHIIGHSLGGHVAGFAGKRVAEKTGRKVGRITGLDVAAPMFEVPVKRSTDSMLNKDDAEFVDVIHTNAGFLGVSDNIGSADFYVENGGPIQPDCFDPVNIFESFGCSHFKSFEYYLESISGKKYEAVSCRNSIEYHILACNKNRKVIMGEKVPKDAYGAFYLETGSPLPYSKLFEGLPKIRINTPMLRLRVN